MATDLTDVLINKQMAKYNPDQFGRRPDLISDSGGNWNAGNNQQLISQGLGNILGAIDAPAQREAMARQEAMAAEQIQYDREQDALTNQLNQRTVARADERLSLDKATAARAAERDRKADLASSAQTKFQAEAFKIGEGIRSEVEANKTILGNLSGSGVLVTNPDGTFSLSDDATDVQKEQFSKVGDIDTSIRNARQKLLKYVAAQDADGISGNEIVNIQQGLSMLETAYKPSTQATQAETDLYNRRVSILNAKRDQDLAATTGAIGNNPELLSIQSDMASMPTGNPADLGKDLVSSAIKDNPRLGDDALNEINTWKDNAKNGDFGKDIQEVVGTPWGEYYLAKAIQQSGGDPWFGAGDFKDKDLVESVRNVMNQADQVRNVVKRQGEITTQHAAELLKLDQLFNSATSGRVTTR
ncbi:hypothetical protein VPHD266_0027 [Vibrio phage D266]